MAKSATARKLDIRSQKGKKAPAAKKKPVLKVVKSASKPAKKAAAPAKKPVLKAVKSAKPAAKVAAKPAIKAVKAKADNRPRDFRVGDYVVYPTHGVGRIVSEETQQISGVSLRMLVIAFEKDRMTLRVPVNRAAAAGLRHVSGSAQMQQVLVTLKSRARTSRGMWSRRAQEYETKINSGNILFIAEVVRDLHPNVDQAERSYSERMIYESALNRLVGEIAASEGQDFQTASDRLLKLLRAKHAA